MDYIWEHIAIGVIFPEVLYEVYDMDSYREERGFTEVHNEIFGITHRGLKTTIEEFCWKINDQDASGSTALFWAVWVGNEHGLQLLLEANADPKIYNINGYAPLHGAAWRSDKDSVYRCVQLLLQARSDIDVNSKSTDDYTPLYLFFLSSPRRNLEMASLLLRNGASTEIPCGPNQHTLLHKRTQHNDAVAVSWLLDHDSNIEALDRNRRTPLSYAVTSNSHDCLKVLLACGASTNQTSFYGTLLHDAARSGDIQTYDILREHEIGNIDIEAKDENGHSAMEYFLTYRQGRSHTLDLAYLKLESSMCSRSWREYLDHLHLTYPEMIGSFDMQALLQME